MFGPGKCEHQEIGHSLQSFPSSVERRRFPFPFTEAGDQLLYFVVLRVSLLMEHHCDSLLTSFLYADFKGKSEVVL